MISRGKYDKERKILRFKHSQLWFEFSKFCGEFCLQVFNFVIFQSWKNNVKLKTCEIKYILCTSKVFLYFIG